MVWNSLDIYILGRLGYVVRLLDPETASRILIKGFVGMISELAFSHKDSNTLACVDEGGNVYVWVIQDENGKLEYPFVIQMNLTDLAILKT